MDTASILKSRTEQMLQNISDISDNAVDQLIDELKAEADRNWFDDPNVTLACGDAIVSLGEATHNQGRVALGTMVRGDGLKLLGQEQHAWDELEHAGAIFRSIGDEFGWARTIIGKLFVAANVNRTEQALEEAAQAEVIFENVGNLDKLLWLQINRAALFSWLGQYSDAVVIYEDLLLTAHRIGTRVDRYLAAVHLNMGYALHQLGQFRTAREHYAAAQSFARKYGNTQLALKTQINIADIDRQCGNFKQALHELQSVLDTAHNSFREEIIVARRIMVSCYTALNRPDKVRDIATPLIGDSTKTTIDVAKVLTMYALSEANGDNYQEAKHGIERAIRIFDTMGAGTHLAQATMIHGFILHKMEHYSEAEACLVECSQYFDSHQLISDQVSAQVYLSAVMLAKGDYDRVQDLTEKVLAISQAPQQSLYIYQAHLLKAKAWQSMQRLQEAKSAYQSAIAVLAKLPGLITVAQYTDFMSDKAEAFCAYIDLCIQQGDFEDALVALEQMKYSVFQNYSIEHNHQLWTQDNGFDRVRFTRLNKLREEHHWLYSQLDSFNNPQYAADPVNQKIIGDQLQTIEDEMRDIMDVLYLGSRGHAHVIDSTFSIEHLQSLLDDKSVIIEYFVSQEHVYAILLSKNKLNVARLSTSIPDLVDTSNMLGDNIDAALITPRQAAGQKHLTHYAQRLLQKLYNQLLAPLETDLENYHHLIVIPYGPLHYIPFNLLYNGQRYLIEQYKLSILPAARLLSREISPVRDSVLIMSNSNGNLLPSVHSEGEQVQAILGGHLHPEQACTRDCLNNASGQVLHIATHAEYRIDAPELSYLQFADGQVSMHDLIQSELRYELVTFSACQTGRATITATEDLIGLGRGVLLAGAQALLVSLWSVHDGSTTEFMVYFYRYLVKGYDKATALQLTQQVFIAGNYHPAFWGAFQLIGKTNPLSINQPK